MNLTQFKFAIARATHEELDSWHDQLTLLHKRARLPEKRLGYVLALDALAEESQARANGLGAITTEQDSMSDEELLAALAE